jgi:phage shock protein PspC (stress-responsive transcriptional regulator)
MYKQLYRSNDNKVIAGVCGGMAEYFNVDPIIVRLCWVIAGLTGAGILAYIIAIFFMPLNPDTFRNYESKANQDNNSDEYGGGWNKDEKHDEFKARRSGSVFGIILIVIGLYFLLRQLGIFYWIHGQFTVAAIFIALGALIIYRGRRH